MEKIYIIISNDKYQTPIGGLFLTKEKAVAYLLEMPKQISIYSLYRILEYKLIS